MKEIKTVAKTNAYRKRMRTNEKKEILYFFFCKVNIYKYPFALVFLFYFPCEIVRNSFVARLRERTFAGFTFIFL